MLKRLVGVSQKRECRDIAKNLICWENMIYFQIAMSEKCFESENIFCKTPFVAADLYISLQSKKTFLSPVEKQIPKVHPLSATWIFFPSLIKKSLRRETENFAAEKKNRFLASQPPPADPFVRSAALQWVDRQATYLTYHLTTLLLST